MQICKWCISEESNLMYDVSFLQGMCTFVDRPTRGKLHFAYTRDYRDILKSQQSIKASSPSPSSDNAPRRASNAFADEIKHPVSPENTAAGLCCLFDLNYKDVSSLKALTMIIESYNFYSC